MTNSAEKKISAPVTSFSSIWSLTWPQMLMMFFHFLIGFTDVWVAGRINADVQASFGIVSQCMFFLLVVATAMSSAAVAAISQALGAGLLRRGQRYVLLILWVGLLAGVTIALCGLFFSNALLRVLMVPERIMPVASYFWSVYLYALPANYVFTVSNAAFRARKQVKAPLITMMLVCSINAFASLAFGLGLWGIPNYGYVGVAWATFFSLMAGAVANIILLGRCDLLPCVLKLPWRWIRRGAPYLLKVAGPAAAMQVMWQTGYLILFAITGSLPAPANSVTALAGLTAGMRLESMLFLPALAFNMTASILVGNFLGAGQKEEAKRVGLQMILAGCGAMTLFAACMWPWVHEVAAFLAPEPPVTLQTVSYLHYNLLSIPFTVASMTLGGIMTGAGATLYTFIVYTAATWLVRLPCAWVLGHLVWKDASGVFVSMLISQIFQSTITFWLFLYTDWTRFSMRSRKEKARLSRKGKEPVAL